MLYRLLADLILIVHFGFILWVVLGLVLILIGRPLGWRWVRNRWVRVAHLASIGFVVVQAWLGEICPLTTWESELRVKAGQQPYSDNGFIADHIQAIMFYSAPPHYFVIGYTLFGLLVAASFFLVPVWWRGRPSENLD